jgi:hypothetical protein
MEILQNFEVLLPISHGCLGKGEKTKGFSLVLRQYIPLMEKSKILSDEHIIGQGIAQLDNRLQI